MTRQVETNSKHNTEAHEALRQDLDPAVDQQWLLNDEVVWIKEDLRRTTLSTYDPHTDSL